MQCPKCHQIRLKPYKIADGLVALGCHHCEGILLSLLNYRHWQETSIPDTDNQDLTQPRPISETKSALICPKCHKLMCKFRIAAASGQQLDMCTNCAEVWMDQGEWELLAQLQIQEQLPKIFTEPWQTRIRRTEKQEKVMQNYRQILGQTDFDKVIEFKHWLSTHPHQALLKAILLHRPL